MTPFDNSKYVDGKIILNEEELAPNHKYKKAMDRVRKEGKLISFVQESIEDVMKLVRQIHEKFG